MTPPPAPRRGGLSFKQKFVLEKLEEVAPWSGGFTVSALASMLQTSNEGAVATASSLVRRHLARRGSGKDT